MTTDFPKIGELVRVDGHTGIIIKEARQTAKVFWLYPKWSLAESWVHYDRLERL
mgnify:FL=1|jgi:hypothetical protein